MKYFIFLTCFVLCNFSCKKRDDKSMPIFEKNTKVYELFKNKVLVIDSLSFNKKINLDDTYWMPVDYILNLNSKGFDNIEIRNSKDYPYEFIHIENWNQKKIYANSSGYEYKKVRLEKINDSTLYLTDFNIHHFKNKDSIFFARRGKQFYVLTKSDSIAYCNGIGEFSFEDKFIYKLQKDIFLAGKQFNVYDEKNKLIATDVYFDLVKDTVYNFSQFRTFKNTSYSKIISRNGLNEQSESLVKINDNNWYFYIGKSELIFKNEEGVKYIFKPT